MSRVVVNRENVTMDLTSYYFNKRTVWLFDSIDDNSAQDLCQQLIYLDSIKQSPIHMNIQSGGGSVYSALSIIGTMQAIKSPVYITVCGIAASAAALITIFGEVGHRTILEHATLMFHQVISSNPARKSFPDIEIDYLETKRLNDKIFQMIHSRLSHLSAFELKNLIERDWFLDAEAAKRYGMVDRIRLSSINGEELILSSSTSA